MQVEELETELKKTRKRSYALETKLLSRTNGFYDATKCDDLQDLATTNHKKEHLSRDITKTNYMAHGTSHHHTEKTNNTADDSGDSFEETNHMINNNQNKTKSTNHTRDNSRDPTKGANIISRESPEPLERTNEAKRKLLYDQLRKKNHIKKDASLTSGRNNNKVACTMCLREYETDLGASFVESTHEVFYPEKETRFVSDCQMNLARRRSSV